MIMSGDEIIKLVKKIEEFSLMPKNWDGYGALRVSEETKQNALRALETMLTEAPMPDITPNPNGTLSFEWETPSGVAHLEIGQTRFSFYAMRGVSAPLLLDGNCDEWS